VGQTFLSASWGGFPAAPTPDWKVRRMEIGRFCNQPAVRLRRLQWLWLPRCRNQALRCLSTRNDDETSDCWAERAAPWSAAARGRLGWAVSSNARTVAPKESGDTSPHFKMSNLQTPDWKVRRTGRLESLPHVVCGRIAGSQLRNSDLTPPRSSKLSSGDGAPAESPSSAASCWAVL